MSFSEDYLDDDYDSFFNEEEAKDKVKICREYIDSDRTLANIDFIEEVIQICLECDLIED